MTGKERVTAVIRHRKPDRIPLYGWVRANLEEPITEQFGSVEAFEDHYDFDAAHIFGGSWMYTKEALAEARDADGRITPAGLLKARPHDVDDPARYEPIAAAVEHHGTERGRFTYVQTPGIFEANNGYFGIENHLMYLALHEDDLHEVYRRQAEFSARFAGNCLDVGVDMVHVSDDWGAQRGPLFSPEMWRRLIYPYHKVIADAVKARGAFLSLHSDGNVNDLVDGILELGFDVVHPWQESAGMSLDSFRENYRDRLTVMGGLDVQETIGFGDYDRLRSEIDRVLTMFRDGGLIFCTTHFVQDHCSLEELTLAFDHARQRIAELAG